MLQCFHALDAVTVKNITVSGTALNHEGQPLAGSTISISGLATNTDAQGAFSLPGLARKNLLLIISHVDYHDEITPKNQVPQNFGVYTVVVRTAKTASKN